MNPEKLNNQENSVEVDPENDIRNLLQEKLDKLRGSLQYVENDPDTYNSFNSQIRSTERLFNKASLGRYFDEVVDEAGTKSTAYDQVRRSVGFKPEEPEDMPEYEKRKARAVALLKFMDQFKVDQNGGT